jgi:two-component sensor histidine kinase
MAIETVAPAIHSGGDAMAAGDPVAARLCETLPLLADLLHSDVMLVADEGEGVAVLEHAQPSPVPSVYHESMRGRRLRLEDLNPSLRRGQAPLAREGKRGMVIEGVPLVRELVVVPRVDGGRTLTLVTDTAVLEQGRLEKRNPVFRRSIERIRDEAIEGTLRGAGRLGRFGRLDGVMVVDDRGRIVYLSAIAEGLYRLLGIVDSVMNARLEELETNEFVVLRAIETGECQEHRGEEQDRTWVRRVIPLLPARPAGDVLERLKRTLRPIPTGALVYIADVTDDVERQRQVEVKEAMITDLHHRVKNNLTTVAALLEKQALRSNSDEVVRALQDAVSRIHSVAEIHEYLSYRDTKAINMREAVGKILEEVRNGTLDPSKNVELKVEGARQFLLPVQQATSCALVINELVQNSVEHGFEGRDHGTITVRLSLTDDSMTVEVVDDGNGLRPDFDPLNAGLGLEIVRKLVEGSLRGRFVLHNENGVRAEVTFPRRNVAEELDKAN